MSDPTTITKDVKEMVRKTWCEGPLTLKVNQTPFLTRIILRRFITKACYNIIEEILTSGFCRSRKRDLNSTRFGTIPAP
jgi:hypothetical protein